MACKSQPELPELNILNCLERDQWDLLHPSRLTKKFIDGGLSTAQCMHSRDIRGHHGCVNAVEFSNNDEDLLMTGGDDRRILLWRTCELIEGKHRSVAMEGLHESNIFSLAFSSNNAYAYSAGNDGVVKKHDIRSTKCIQEHTYGDMPAIYCLSANPSSPDVILSASEDGAVSLIDTRLPTGLARNVVIQSRSSYQSVCFNPVESNLLAVGNSVFGAALYDLRMNKKLLAYDPTWYSQYRQDVVSVRFDWSGTRLLTLQREFPPTVFNIHENRALYQLIDDTGAYSNSVTMKSGCFLGHNDEYVASGSDDFRCFIWRIPHGGTLEKGRGTTLVPHLVLPGHRSIVNQVRYSSVHHLLCSSGVEKVFKLWSHLPLLANDKIQWSKAPPPRRRYSHLAFLDMWDEGRDTSEEDDHVLAFFDALIEQEGMMNSHPDDSNSSSSSSPPQGDNRPLDSLSLSSSDRDDNEEESSSDVFPFWPSDWSSPANTSSLEPPWLDSDQSLLELGGSGEETGENRDEGSLDNDDTSEDDIRSVSIVEGALGDDTAVLALRPSNNVTREGPLEDATGGTELRERNVAGEPRTLNCEVVLQPSDSASFVGKSS